MPLTTTLGGEKSSRARGNITWWCGGLLKPQEQNHITDLKLFFFFLIMCVCYVWEVLCMCKKPEEGD